MQMEKQVNVLDIGYLGGKGPLIGGKEIRHAMMANHI
jgi:hypothetical protein